MHRLLDLESQAEAREIMERARRLDPAEAERSGLCLIGLVAREERSGLGGRMLLTLSKRNANAPLPWTRLQTGTPILLTIDNRAGSGFRGVMAEKSERSVCVAINDLPDDIPEDATYRIDLASDEVAFRRQRSALERARAAKRNRLAELREVLLGRRSPEFGADRSYTALDPTLNDSQQAAVSFALAARDIAVIHGPPGTGKTTTVVEVIRQAIRRGDKVLACAPSNLAVDNLLERLLRAGELAVRLGHPVRVLPELRAHTLDMMVEEHNDALLARKLSKEAFALFRKASKYTRAKPEPGARRDMRQEARQLLADARRLEDQAAKSILDGAAVLCATTTSLDGAILGDRKFDLVVIDEACQSTEPGCWIPILRGRRIVLAGDHCQLPPTILSPEAAAGGLNISLLERLVVLFGTQVMRRLIIQYRMHEAIMNFSSQEFYERELEASPTVAQHRLCDLHGVRSNVLTETPVQFIDTAGAGYDEEPEPDGESRLNPQEATLVCGKVRELLDLGVAATSIGIIAPYAAQVRLLRERLDVPGVEIDSIDGFQGREKEAIVLSLVRSNPEGEIGFLGDVRRLNVAMTRARRKLLIIGDSATLGGHPFYQRLLDYFDCLGTHHSVWEEEMHG